MTLDEIRADIVRRHDAAQERIDRAIAEREIAHSEMVAHDRAVAAMPVLNGAAKPERAKRRDIAALVRAALTDEPQRTDQIAQKIGVPPSRVFPALQKVGTNVEGKWVRP